MSRMMRLLCARDQRRRLQRQAAPGRARPRPRAHARRSGPGSTTRPPASMTVRIVHLHRLVADGGDALAFDDDLAVRAQPARRRCRRPWRCGRAGARSWLGVLAPLRVHVASAAAQPPSAARRVLALAAAPPARATGTHLVDRADALAAAPDVLPGLGRPPSPPKFILLVSLRPGCPGPARRCGSSLSGSCRARR